MEILRFLQRYSTANRVAQVLLHDCYFFHIFMIFSNQLIFVGCQSFTASPASLPIQLGSTPVESSSRLSATKASTSAVTASVPSFTLSIHDGSKYLDIQNQSKADHALLNLWDFGTASQSFQAFALPDGTYQVKSTYSGKCLDLMGDVTANGTRASLYRCNSQIPTQHWNFKFDSGNSNLWKIVSAANSNYCLDLNQDATSNATLIHLWQCLNIPSQTWQIHFSTDQFSLATDVNGLQTWWHHSGEINSTSPVSDLGVRRSSFYDVKVSLPSAPFNKYESFVYMSIPRNGMQKVGYAANEQDGAEIAVANHMTMSWSSFIYGSEGAWVDVKFFDQTITSPSDVKIQPASLNVFSYVLDPHTLSIYLPFSQNGYRFSVQPKDDFITLINSNGNQNLPRNAMLIFAEPNTSSFASLAPQSGNSSIYYPSPGMLSAVALNQVTQHTIYFNPGVYSMPATEYVNLQSSVHSVYLAPGAYVKGAFIFSPSGGNYSVAGMGILSGENYVYMPNKSSSPPLQHASDSMSCLSGCLNALQFNVQQPSSLQLSGITLANPFYHSFVFFEANSLPTSTAANDSIPFPMNVNHYKQVGAYFWQTNGVQMSDNSTMSHVFLHANDDAIVVWGINQNYEDSVIWQGSNGAPIQFGWDSKNIINTTLDGMEIIYNQMESLINTCVISSTPSYNGSAANSLKNMSNVVFKHIHVNDKVDCAIQITALQNMSQVHINHLSIDAWTDLPRMSEFTAAKDQNGHPVKIGGDLSGLQILNFKVGGKAVSKWDNTWQSNALGHLNFDASLWNAWNAWVDPRFN